MYINYSIIRRFSNSVIVKDVYYCIVVKGISHNAIKIDPFDV